MGPLFVNVIFYMNALVPSTELKTALLAAGQRGEESRQHYEWLRVRQWLALLLWEAGEAQQAEQECKMLLMLLEQENRQQTSIGGYLCLSLARVYRARNRRAEAWASLTRALQLAQNWQYVALLTECYECEALMALDEGDLDRAERALQALRGLERAGNIAIRLPQVDGVQVQLWLAQGQLVAAQAWATRLPGEPEALTDVVAWESCLARIRVNLAQQDYATALSGLERLLSSAQECGRLERVAQALALQVVALDGLKKRAEARQVALHLLKITRPAGLVRVYLEAGAAMYRTLRHLLALPASLPRELAEHLALLLDAFASETAAHTPVAPSLTRPGEKNAPGDDIPAQFTPLETLSSQEQRVLRLLVAGRTYAEIAREFIVSPNTIKTQVSSIYRKLGVSRRAEASLVARHFNLL
jgi:LuxR family maltose regulon positive regulatory protein